MFPPPQRTKYMYMYHRHNLLQNDVSITCVSDHDPPDRTVVCSLQQSCFVHSSPCSVIASCVGFLQLFLVLLHVLIFLYT